MAQEHAPRGRAQDRAQVTAGEAHEVRYEAEKKGVEREDVKQAVKSIGNSRKKVEEHLAKDKEPGEPG